MDSQYLQETVGQCLVECLADVTLYRPRDPIEFIGRWLRHHVNYCTHIDREKLLAQIKEDSKPHDGPGASVADGDSNYIDDGTTGSEEIEDIVLEATSHDLRTQIRAVRACRKILSSQSSPPIDDVIEAGLLPILVECMKSRHPKLLFEAGWALTNVASGTSEQTQAVVEAGAVQHFVRLLDSKVEDVRDQCTWALGNIIGDGSKLRDHCIEQGVIPPLLRCVEDWNDNAPFLRNAAWLVVNLFRDKGDPMDEENVKKLLPTVVRLVEHPDNKVKCDALWALSYLSDGANMRIQWVLDTGVVDKVVPLVTHEDNDVKTPALRMLGNIVTGDDTQTQVVVDSGVLSVFSKLMDRDKSRKEAFWFLSNITAGTRDQVQAVVDAGLLPLLKYGLSTECDFATQKEAAWAVANLTLSGDKEQIEAMMEAEVIPPLCDLLNCGDNRIKEVVLDGLHNMLKAVEEKVEHMCQLIEDSGGLELIDDLRDRSDGSDDDDNDEDQPDGELHMLAGKIFDIWVSNHSTEAIIEKVSSEEMQTKIRGFKAAQNILKTPEDVDKLLASDFIIHLKDALKHDDPGLQEAAAFFIKVMSEEELPERYRDTVIDAGILPLLMSALIPSQPSLYKEAATALRNLLSDADATRRLERILTERKLLPTVVAMAAEVSDPSLQECTAELLRTLFDKYLPLPSSLFMMCLPAILCNLHRRHAKALEHYTAILETYTSEEFLPSLSASAVRQLEDIILPALISLVNAVNSRRGCDNVLTGALNTVHSLLARSCSYNLVLEGQTQRLQRQHSELLEAVNYTLCNKDNRWTWQKGTSLLRLLNIVVTDTSSIDDLITGGGMRHFLHHLESMFFFRNTSDFTIVDGEARAAAIAALLNMVHYASPDQISQFLEYNVLLILEDALEFLARSTIGIVNDITEVTDVLLILLVVYRKSPDQEVVRLILQETECPAIVQRLLLPMLPKLLVTSGASPSGVLQLMSAVEMMCIVLGIPCTPKFMILDDDMAGRDSRHSTQYLGLDGLSGQTSESRQLVGTDI